VIYNGLSQFTSGGLSDFHIYFKKLTMREAREVA